MFMPSTSAFAHANRAVLTVLPPVRQAAGLSTGSLVETAVGWRAVETLAPGNRVQTFDGGLRAIRRVERRGLPLGPKALVRVPGGVLNACADLLLPRDQAVLLDTPEAAAILGNPLTLVPAAALVGHRGTCWKAARSPAALFRLVFDDEEVIFVNSGVLIHCPGDAAPSFFPALDAARGADLVGLIGADVWRGRRAA
jgi:hypothetical protein